MPRINKRKFAPKRRLIRKKRMVRRTGLTNRALQPVAQRYFCKMKYSESVTSDANGHFYFNLNSIFDPNRSGIGHQPYGRDTLATLYNRYRVIACGYRIQVLRNPADSLTIGLGAIPANEQLLFAGFDEIRENPRAKYVVSVPTANMPVLSGKVYIPSLVGRTKSQYMADDRYQAQENASPQELAILNILTANAGGIPLSGYPISIVLEYTVEWFDVKHLTQS